MANLKEQKKVTKLENVTIGHKCDNCGKVINTERFPDEWHHFSSHHNEWGNDSCDSYEYYDVCSAKCYVEKFTDVVENELNGRSDAEVDDKEIQFARVLVDYFKSVGN